MIQTANGSFIPSDTALFNRFRMCEDVDAQFIDANGDGHLDLWVVAGGNQMPLSPISNADRLYLNDGNGKFTVILDDILRYILINHVLLQLMWITMVIQMFS